MHKFKIKFKEFARDKKINSGHMLALCIFRAVKSTSENKSEVLDDFIKKSFTPGRINSSRPNKYHAVSIAWDQLYFSIRKDRRWNVSLFAESEGSIFNTPLIEIFDEEELTSFRELFEEIKDYGNKEWLR